MADFLLNHEPTIRLTPRRRQEIPKVLRWTNYLNLVVIETAILRLTFPVLAVGLAGIADANGWGLFNMVDLPHWVAVIASNLMLDLAIYLQHIVFHAAPGLWRLHRMHHTGSTTRSSRVKRTRTSGFPSLGGTGCLAHILHNRPRAT